MPISDVVVITVTLQAGAVTRAGFGTVLIAGLNSPGGTVEEYTSLAAMDSDGWAGTEEEYLAATAAFAQSIRPQSVKIGLLSAFVAQVDTITIDGSDDGTYTIDINGTDFEYTAASKTATEIRDELITLVNAGSEPVTAAPVTTITITLTADNAGEPFTTTLEGTKAADMTLTLTTPNNGYGEGLSVILAADSDWYGVYGCDDEDYHILARAVWTESRRKLHLAQSSAVAIYDAASTTDIAYVLSAANYARTALLYHPTATQHAACGWMADRLAVDVDSKSTAWNYVTLPTITVQTLTTTQQSAIEGKNANHYQSYAGTGITYKGTVADGTAIELIVVADWLYYRLTEIHQQTFIDYANAGDKLPYTDDGITQIESDARSIVDIGIKAKHFIDFGEDDEPEFDFPGRADCSDADILAGDYRYSLTVHSTGKILTVNGTVDLATT